MRSTFMGLEASKRGLFTQQSALYTTGHNISNANTEGYTRQRVNMETTLGYPGAGLNSPTTAGHIGTGVQVHSVQRMRDEFTDRQYRQETNKLGYWSATTKAISQMEDVMSEPSEFGINQAFTEFWKSMEDVVNDPKDTAARQVMISKGESLAESFNYMDTQLKLIQGNLGNEIKVTTNNLNSILKKIADLNDQINTVEPNGYLPNDLYDARDKLVDELNELIPVSISYQEVRGNAVKGIAEGSMTISFKPYGTNTEIKLVEGREYVHVNAIDTDENIIDGDIDDAATGEYKEFSGFAISDLDRPPTGTNVVRVDYDSLEPGKGQLVSLIDSFGHSGGEGIYPEMLEKLDKLAEAFILRFNEVHSSGVNLNGDTGIEFFSGDSARTFKVEISSANEVAAASVANEVSNNLKALELAALQSETQQAGSNIEGSTFQNFYKSLIGDLGVIGEQAARLEYNSTTLRLTIENSRASFNSVSLDEEMTNMITFQQAYNANARMITVVDETLDKIINGMGRVGL
jgi:flagellar hook-associated protein 1